MSLQGQAKVSVSLIVSYDGRIVLEGESTGSKKLLLKFSKKKKLHLRLSRKSHSDDIDKIRCFQEKRSLSKYS